eukprot:TRINITY_DN18307_c0_g1_i1.p1 TRINITY_DN18307_c0_g1~~TRINITY_DN18307_c0_g1_i1.p1  ORF type:complete len:510 (-),score=76.59 TRINITY_DN18307_c0_g1_i1:10-1314(-)
MAGGYLWFTKGDRTLPFWSLYPLRPIANFLFRFKWVSNVVVGIFYGSLVLDIISDFNLLHVPKELKVVYLPVLFMGLMSFMCFIDLWRFFYYNYWLICLSGFYLSQYFNLLDTQNSIEMVRIMLASVYFWSGFGKLVHPVFYTDTAPYVFPVFYTLIRKFITIFKLSGRTQTYLQYFVAGSGVGVEMLMGLIFFFPSHFPLPILQLALFFNAFMHVFIVIFIGLSNRIFTFLCWNMMNLALTQIVFSPHILGDNIPFSWWNTFGYLLWTLFPLTVLFGKCPDGCLSHSYFAPGWYGTSFILVSNKKINHLPKTISGQPLRNSLLNNRNLRKCLPSIRKLLTDADILQTFNITAPQTELSDYEFEKLLSDELVIIDESIVDLTFRLSPTDPFQTHYGAGPYDFWDCLVKSFGTPALYVLVNQFSVTGMYNEYCLM